MSTMLDWARWYNEQGICVVPVKPRDKAVALPTWDEYHTRCSTAAEIDAWWTATPTANIGLVHGVNGFVSLDFDHDAGVFDKMRAQFSKLFDGRVEQSGSGNGYHLPLFVETFPDLGWDNSRDRPKGNKTWHCKNGSDLGDVNIRARWCQTVAPPSVHPCGGHYTFIQKGSIATASDLTAVVAWLNRLDPQQAQVIPRRERKPATGRNSTDDIKQYFPSVLDAFRSLGLTGDEHREPNGEVRLSGYGGLLVNETDGEWYCFGDETGGDVIDAVGWVTYGSRWDRYNKSQFANVIRQMKDMAGIGTTRAALPEVKAYKRNLCGDMIKNDYWVNK